MSGISEPQTPKCSSWTRCSFGLDPSSRAHHSEGDRPRREYQLDRATCSMQQIGSTPKRERRLSPFPSVFAHLDGLRPDMPGCHGWKETRRRPPHWEARRMDRLLETGSMPRWPDFPDSSGIEIRNSKSLGTYLRRSPSAAGHRVDGARSRPKIQPPTILPRTRCQARVLM